MFRTLQTKLTVLYASLFAAILVVTAMVTYAAVSSDALRAARRELTVSGGVFDRVWALRTAQLRNGAGLLSRDFGFREALASNDAATIDSALDNLKRRLGIDLAATVGVDGRMSGAGAGQLAGLSPQTLAAIESDDGAAGVAMLNGAPYELVSVPVQAPVTMGWVVFAERLDGVQMRSFESMAAAPLQASIVHDRSHGRGAASTVERVAARGGDAMVLVKPLNSIDPDDRAALVLKYPVARALAPYRALFGLIGATALGGLAALLFGARALARTISRPVSELEAAAMRMERGEISQVKVTSADEIGRLATAFNRMVAVIGQRDAERERAAAALARARDQAESANRAKSAFLANMSHEVRTPLNGVLGMAGVLETSELDAAQREMLGVIQSSATSLERVLNEVLDFARLEAGGTQIVTAPFVLDDMLAPFAKCYETKCEAKGLTFRLDLDRQARGRVAGDAARLRQILDALLDNALRFTDHGAITLAVRRERSSDGACVFEVADTGTGFDPALAEELFKPFRQADESNTRRYGGAGLGLSIARELARTMGGELSAEGRPGEGATFVLTLPLAAVAETLAPARATRRRGKPADDAREAATVLLADDHAINRQVVRLILETAGAQITEVENGAEAVDAFKTGGFDLVLMDMQMPVMDGLTAIRLIRSHERLNALAAAAVLVISANAMPEHVEAALAAGADGHVAKPVTPPGLLAAVEETRSRARRDPSPQRAAE
jgi:signal transduction histidine kinase/CheY-like chemotaxis protein